MKENDVAFFGTLLGIGPEVVEGLITDGLLSDKVKAAVMNLKDVETMKGNYAKEVKTTYLNELSESAKKGDIPQELYKPIHGAVSEKLEKALSKKFNVADFESVEDLVSKAISINKGQSDDTKLTELQTLNTDLQEANKRLVKEKEEAEKRIKGEFESQLINRDLTDLYNNVPFDLSDVKEDELDAAKDTRKFVLKGVFETNYSTKMDEGKLVVTDKKGEMLKDPNTFAPIPVSNVLTDLAKKAGLKLKSPESGGQGGSSSGNKGSRFKDVAEFYSYCSEKGIAPTSNEGLVILKDSGLKLY